MTTTPDLGIPELAQSQANPDITHNEALVLIQALLNGVIDKDLTAPPVSPSEGDSYIVGAAPTGAWSGREDSIAIYWGATWRFVPGNDDAGSPITMGARHEGLRVFVRDEGILYIWTGSPLNWTAQVTLTDGDKGDITVGSGGTTLTIENNAVSNAKLRDSAAVSVIGRAANSSGDPADIAAAANDRLLTRVADALAFTQLTNGMVPTNTLGLDKLVNASAQYNLLGRTSSGSGAWQEKATSSDVFAMLGAANNAAIRTAIGAVNIAGDTMTGNLTLQPSGTNVALTLNAPAGFGATVTVRGETFSGITPEKYSADAQGPSVTFRKHRGSRATPAAANLNDACGSFQFQFYDGSGYQQTATLTGRVVAATPSATDAEGQVEILAPPAGSVINSEVARVRHSTGFSMFGANPVIDQNRLHRMRVYTVGTLPAAGTNGRRAAVSDSNAAITAGIGAVVAGGGANAVPVYDDGTNWRIV